MRKFWSMTLDTASSAVCGGKMQKWIVLARVRHHVGRDESVLEGSVVMNDDEARAGLSHPYHIKRFFCFSLALAPSTSSSLMLAFDRHWWQQKPTSSGNSVASASALALYFPLSDQSYVNIVFYASRHDLNWDFKANVICAFRGFQSPFSTYFAL